MPPRHVRCRKAGASDAAAIVRLLAKGFPDRTVDYWRRAIDRLGAHAARLGMSHLGYLLECDGVPVGVLLLIFSADPAGKGGAVRCNVSSWYAEPEFVSYGSVLINMAARDKHVTFFNISPAQHVRPIIEAQGFRQYGRGRFWALPALGRWRGRVRIERLKPGLAAARDLDAGERDLIEAHLSYGCMAFQVTSGGECLPFAVLPRLTKGIVPSAQLVYCRDIADLTRFAGPIGRFLLLRGMPVMAIDADGPVPGLVGAFATDDVPKYFKGPDRPRIGDLSNTELVMFGP